VRGFFDELFAAIPDLETTVDRVVAGGNTAAVQYRMRGTFSGDRFQGLDPVGKSVTIRGCDVIDVEDGRIVRNTAYQDGLEFARQIGMLPPQGSGVEKALYGAFNGMNKLRTTIEDRIGGLR
jgi:predicted ester cyclase